MKGRRIRYSDEELAFVRERSAMSRVALHAAFVARFGDRHDVSVDSIKALCTRNGWVARRQWTPEQDAVILEHYPNRRTAEIAALLALDVEAVWERANVLGVKKSAEFLASAASGRLQAGTAIGRATQYKKGQEPLSKGTKRPAGWAPGRMRHGQFKKGQRPSSWYEIGSTRVVDGYEFTKVSDVRPARWTTNWKQTHILRWEAIHGPIPAGHCLKCVDSNRLNTDPANWISIPRSNIPRLIGGNKKRLSYDAAPAELKPIVLGVAQLEHAALQRAGRRRQAVA